MLQVVIDEGWNEASLSKAEPYSHVLWPVLHEKCDSVSLLEATLDEVVSHSVAVLINL